MNALNEFKESLNREDIVNWIRSGLIGDDVEIKDHSDQKNNLCGLRCIWESS